MPKVEAAVQQPSQRETVEVSPRPRPIIASSKVANRCEEFRNLVKQYDWNVEVMLAIMMAESSCNPNALNTNSDGSNDSGLFQINSIHKKPNRENPELNVRYAYQIYKSQGLNAWVAYTNKIYLKFMN